MGVLTREDSPLTALEVVRPQDLVGRPLMVSGRELVQNELTNWLGDDAQRLNILIRYNLLYNIAMLVKSGFGDALCIPAGLRLSRSPVYSPVTPSPAGLRAGMEKAADHIACSRGLDCSYQTIPEKHF